MIFNRRLNKAILYLTDRVGKLEKALDDATDSLERLERIVRYASDKPTCKLFMEYRGRGTYPSVRTYFLYIYEDMREYKIHLAELGDRYGVEVIRFDVNNNGTATCDIRVSTVNGPVIYHYNINHRVGKYTTYEIEKEEV